MGAAFHFGSASLLVGALVLGASLAACAASSKEENVDSSEQAAQPIDRLLIGQAARYPADPTLRAKAPVFEASMAERRKMAWQIVERVLMPVKISAEKPEPAEAQQPSSVEPSKIMQPPPPVVAHLELPRFQTWYSREDVLPMFDRLFRGLSDNDKRARKAFSPSAVDDVFPWNATMATSLASFTQERLDARKAELTTAAGVHSLGKDPRVLMSPEYVGHLLHSYGKILDCQPKGLSQINDPTQFAPCLSDEFPAAAVSVKTRWMPDSMSVPTYDTSANALRAKLAAGAFGDGDGQANPTEDEAYTMRLNQDTKTRLVALHIMTKELRDWTWITLWWSPDANSDFGADRPSTITGPFAHYKMCVVTAYDEKDAAPGSSFTSANPSLAAALTASAAEGPATWCSNPYLETSERAAKTSCIGCHQHGGTGETSDSVLADETKFPDFGRKKTRESFPSDYAFTTEGGLDLAAEFRSRVEALTPSQ
jgi:hypothetical protein